MSHLQPLHTQKKRLRSHFRARRDGLDDDVVEKASRGVCQHLKETSWLDDVERLAGYMALGKEIDVRGFLNECMERNVEIVLPRVVGPGQMEFCLVQSWDELEPGAFGIDEPTTAAIESESIDAFLVPGLAFDRRGQRLGFGKGFYDRALPGPSQALIVGVGHRWQFIEDDLPAEPHDRPMDHVVTDHKWHQLRNSDATSQE